MEILGEVVDWFGDPANWTGSTGIPVRLLEHLEMSLLATALGAAVALPVGFTVGHTRRGEFLTVSVGNIGRALPSFGVLALVFPFTFDLPGAIGFWPTLIALWMLAIPPILSNSYVGIRDVDASVTESARAMGMTGMQILRKVELPLAASLVVAGLRTATVQVVATATLAALVGWGGLGRFIVDGFATSDNGSKIGGAVLVAALAIVTEIAFGLTERRLSPPESRRRTKGIFRRVGASFSA